MALHIPYHYLVSMVGEERALKLSIAVGGSKLFLPTPARLTARSKIVGLVGEAVALAMCAEVGGEFVYFPVGPGKRARVWAMREAGWTIGAIALELGCTERTVYNNLAYKRPHLLPDVPPMPRRAEQISPPGEAMHPAAEMAAIWTPAANP